MPALNEHARGRAPAARRAPPLLGGHGGQGQRGRCRRECGRGPAPPGRRIGKNQGQRRWDRLCASAVWREEAGRPVSRRVAEEAGHELATGDSYAPAPRFPHLNGLRA